MRFDLKFITILALVGVGSLSARAATLPQDLTYKIDGSCSNNTIKFRAIPIFVHDSAYSSSSEVFLYMNADGTASMYIDNSNNVDSPKFIPTTWKAIDDKNFAVDKLGTLSYYNIPGLRPFVTLDTQNTNFPNLAIGSFPADINVWVRYSSTGQEVAQYCTQH